MWHMANNKRQVVGEIQASSGPAVVQRHKRQVIGEVVENKGMRVVRDMPPLPDPDAIDSFDPLHGLDREGLMAGLRDGTIKTREKVAEAEISNRTASGADDGDAGLDMAAWIGGKDVSRYDPNRVYVRATNVKDHSSTLQMACPREVLHWVSRIVADRPEYKSRADFVRDAILHRIWQLVSLAEDGVIEDDGVLTGEGVRRFLLLQAFQTQQEEQRAELAELTKVVEDADLLFGEIVEAGDPAYMDTTCEFNTLLAEQLPEVWREKLLDVVAKWEGQWARRWGNGAKGGAR